MKSKDKKAQISNVSKGYSDHSYSFKNKLRELLPTNYTYPLPFRFFENIDRNPWTVWHINKCESEDPLEVKLEDVLVPKTIIDQSRHLIDQVFSITSEDITKAYDLIGLNEDVDKYLKTTWISIKLIQMIDASRKFWGDDKVVPNDRSTHPKTKKIEKYLIEKYKFSKGVAGVAKKAASIMRPEFAPKGRPEE